MNDIARQFRIGRSGRLWTHVVGLATGSALLAGCSGLFDVENPNQMLRGDLSNPVAADAVANGALSTVARGLASTILPIAVVGDELKWVGSYDSGRELEQGNLSNALNEFTMSAFPMISEGRWMADEAIRLLSTMDEEGTLADRNHLARSYLYAAIAYVAIGDSFEDFVLSDGRDAEPPLGKGNMVTLYDRAIDYLTRGLAITEVTKKADLHATLLAMRARARHAQGVWLKLHSPQGGGGPLVNDPAAVADAAAFLALPVADDWQFRFQYTVNTIGNGLGSWINERREFRFGDSFIIPDASGKQVASITLRDPIDGVVDPALSRAILEFIGARQYGPLTVTSAREMRLILAEAALASADTATVVQQINLIRGLDALTPYADQVSLEAIFRHTRLVNLFLQGRRLADMYRFQEPSPLWLPTSEAVTKPGAKLPIADIERRANCHIAGTC
jgi:hypothetical protein